EIGLLIEHSHRLIGFMVGTCVIGLAASLWIFEKRRWIRVLGVAALVGICIQGLLGIYRVNLNAVMGRELALIHGCFAQLVFATLVSIAVCTSRRWTDPAGVEHHAPLGSESLAPGLRRWSIVTAGLIYLQVVLGALVRHTSSSFGQRAHLVAAF